MRLLRDDPTHAERYIVIKGFLQLPWLVWAGLAFVVAVIYTFVWPQKDVTVTEGFRFWVIRWGHALAWLLLTINFVLRRISPSWNGTSNLVALTGSVMYFLFMMTSFVMK